MPFVEYEGFGVVHLSISPHRIIEVEGKIYQFDMHHYCGPMPCNKDGSDRKTPWPKRAWEAVQAWIDQGKKLYDDESCVYKLPKKEKRATSCEQCGAPLCGSAFVIDNEGPVCRACYEDDTYGDTPKSDPDIAGGEEEE